MQITKNSRYNIKKHDITYGSHNKAMATVSCTGKDRISVRKNIDQTQDQTVNIPDAYHQHETIHALLGFEGCSSVQMEACLSQKTILFTMPALRQ